MNGSQSAVRTVALSVVEAPRPYPIWVLTFGTNQADAAWRTWSEPHDELPVPGRHGSSRSRQVYLISD